jgi:transcriptional regulator of arginine metabolism
MQKLSRQKTILELLESGPVASQEELQKALAKHGVKVGQATLSRDIHELGLVKTAEGYSVSSSNVVTEPALPPLSRLMGDFVLDLRLAQNLLVIKTTVGSAQPVAAALDAESWPEVVGSVAGDDTILMVCPNKKAAAKLASRIREMIA